MKKSEIIFELRVIQRNIESGVKADFIKKQILELTEKAQK